MPDPFNQPPTLNENLGVAKVYDSLESLENDKIKSRIFQLIKLAQDGHLPETGFMLNAKDAKDRAKLYEEAQSELEAIQTKQKFHRETQEERERLARQQAEKSEKEFLGNVVKGIEQGINGNPIPIPERKKFLNRLLLPAAVMIRSTCSITPGMLSTAALASIRDLPW